MRTAHRSIHFHPAVRPQGPTPLRDMPYAANNAIWVLSRMFKLAETWQMVPPGRRCGEILSLKWDDVDRTTRVLRLRDAKTGPRMVPLTGPVLKVLDGIEREESVPWVLRGARPGSRLASLSLTTGSVSGRRPGLATCGSTTCATALRPAPWRSGRPCR